MNLFSDLKLTKQHDSANAAFFQPLLVFVFIIIDMNWGFITWAAPHSFTSFLDAHEVSWSLVNVPAEYIF